MKRGYLIFFLLFIFIFGALCFEEPEEGRESGSSSSSSSSSDKNVDSSAPDTVGEESVHEKEQTILGFISSPDVTSAYFLKSKLYLGVTNEILLGFGNTGDKPFKVQYIRGYIVSPMDYNYFIQNFTGVAPNVSVESNEVNTLIYSFKPDRSLDSREYGVVVDVFYTNPDNDTFATRFYNETVTLFEGEQGFDARTFFAYVALVGIVVLVLYGSYRAFLASSFSKKFKHQLKSITSPSSHRTSTTEKMAAASTCTDEAVEEWLPDYLKTKKIK